jgi:hypothetical protein
MEPITPQTNADGSPVLADQRITRLSNAADAHERQGQPNTAAWYRDRADQAREEARLANAPRRWERHRRS